MEHGKYRRAAAGLAVLICLSTPVWADDAPPSGERLTLDEAIRTALEHHPALMAARGTLRAGQARVGEARSDYLPQLSLNSEYTRSTANFAPTPSSGAFSGSTSGKSSNNSYNNYSASMVLQQRIFDFGKTGAELEAARANLRGSDWDEQAARQSVAVNVKVAFFGLLEARRLVEVQEETVRQFEEHLRQVEGFHRAGTRARFDVTKAEVDLTNAQLELIKAKNAEAVARVSLANTMGVPDRPIGELEDLLSFKKVEITEADAVREALESRPELLSLSAQRKAAEASILAAQRDGFPVLSGVADYTYRGADFPLVWNWNVGVNLSFPIFSGYLTQSRIAENRANLDVVGANEESLRQNILLEVHQAVLNLEEAGERVQTSEVVVRQAEENLDLANGRFQAGLGTSVERTDAQVLLTNAKTSRIQALYDYRTAEARLMKAIGRKE